MCSGNCWRANPDAAHIRVQLTVGDLKFYTHPFEFNRTWVLGKPGEGLMEYACSMKYSTRAAPLFAIHFADEFSENHGHFFG